MFFRILREHHMVSFSRLFFFAASIMLSVFYLVYIRLYLALRTATTELLVEDKFHVNSFLIIQDFFDVAREYWYFNLCQAISMGIGGLYCLHFLRLRFSTSMVFQLMKRPLILMVYVLVLLSLTYFIFSLIAQQMWGSRLEEFRTLSGSFYTILSLFSMHSG